MNRSQNTYRNSHCILSPVVDNMFLFTIFLSVLTIAVALPTPPRPTTTTTTTLAGPIQPTCYYNGTSYYPGEEYQATPCEHCRCDDVGQTLCEQQPCRSPSCVDSVHLPGVCCPVCPNGANCRHSDGTIIKSGEKYHPDFLTTCYCQTTPLGIVTTVPICETILPGPIPGR